MISWRLNDSVFMKPYSQDCRQRLAIVLGCTVAQLPAAINFESNQQVDDKALMLMLSCDDTWLYGKAFEFIYLKYSDMVVQEVIRNHGSQEDGEDTFMESIEILMKYSQKQEYQIHSTLKGWILTVSRNLWKRKNSKKSYSMVHTFSQLKMEQSPEMMSEVLLEQEIAYLDRQKWMLKAIDQLPEKARLALLYELQDKPRKEIQEMLGHGSIDSTNNLISHAKKELINMFQSQENIHIS